MSEPKSRNGRVSLDALAAKVLKGETLTGSDRRRIAAAVTRLARVVEHPAHRSANVEDIKAAIGKAYPSLDDMTREMLIAKLDRIHTLAFRNLK